MASYDDTEYLLVLERDSEAPNIHRVCRDSNAELHLVESIIRETTTLNRKEVWALESGEDHSSMSTGSENGFEIGQEPITGRLVPRGEPKIQVSKLGVVYFTKTLLHQSFTTGSTREVKMARFIPCSKTHLLESVFCVVRSGFWKKDVEELFRGSSEGRVIGLFR